jgi:DNA primase
LVDAGLLSTRTGDEKDARAGSLYDRFRNRIMIPIRDERGRMVGFGARILDPEDIPKFLNSPQTPLFDKGRLLYGLDRARKEIRSRDQAVIVEGYLDVIALHQAGFANVVSPMGTALTETQLALLKRFSRRIVLALDPDAAGAKATLRGLQIARQALDREAEMAFDARGLLSQENRLQADIRVVTLPDGLDPDDLVRRDPAEWERLVMEARPIVIHVMETLSEGQNLDDPKVKSEIANQVLPLIEDIPDPFERETYRQRLARLLKVDERVLLDERQPQRRDRMRSSPGRRTGKRQEPATLPVSSGPISAGLEDHCLGVLMRHPNLVYRIDRAMQEFGLPRISSKDFQRAENQTIFALIQESLEQNLSEPLQFVLNSLSLPMMDQADLMLSRTEKLDPVEDRVFEDVLRAVLNLRKIFVQESLGYLRFALEEAQAQGNSQAHEYRESVQQFSVFLRNLNAALGRYTSRI